MRLLKLQKSGFVDFERLRSIINVIRFINIGSKQRKLC